MNLNAPNKQNTDMVTGTDFYSEIKFLIKSIAAASAGLTVYTFYNNADLSSLTIGSTVTIAGTTNTAQNDGTFVVQAVNDAEGTKTVSLQNNSGVVEASCPATAFLTKTYAKRGLDVNARAISSLVPEPKDYIALTYVAAGNGAGEIETVTYKIGGASGTIVAVLTLTYNSSNKLLTVTRS